MHFVEAGDAPLVGWREYRSQNLPPGDNGDRSADDSVVVDEDDAAQAESEGPLHAQRSTEAWGGSLRWATPAPMAAATARVRYRPFIRRTGVYWVEPFLPSTDWLNCRHAPYVVHPAGDVVALQLYQQYRGGTFYPLGEGRRFKLRAGAEAFVEQHNATGDALWRTLVFDAVRFTYLGPPGPLSAGAACADSVECDGELVCRDGLCAD
jgi:hypothetical protein